MEASISGVVVITDFWNDQVLDTGREGIFLALSGFLVSFVFIRTSTRLMRSPKVPWWPGSVSTGDVHVHHLVFGIVLMLVAPTIAYAIPDQSPWWELTAVAFGIGAGLTFDEFALWLHLEDVYWAEQGRTSIDAVAIAAVFMAIVFLGSVPFEIDSSDAGLFWASLGLLLISLGTSVICFGKGKLWNGGPRPVLVPDLAVGDVPARKAALTLGETLLWRPPPEEAAPRRGALRQPPHRPISGQDARRLRREADRDARGGAAAGEAGVIGTRGASAVAAALAGAGTGSA